MLTDDDFRFMKRALELARIAADEGEIPAGAVIVKDGHVIGEGRNRNRSTKNPVNHAEINAICAATRSVQNERLCGCSLYVTKEPCTMCAGAIIHARIEALYIGAPDTKYGACGTVFTVCGDSRYNHNPRFFFNVLGEECRDVLKNFFKNIRLQKKQKRSSQSDLS